jgi:hypothetical protein
MPAICLAWVSVGLRKLSLMRTSPSPKRPTHIAYSDETHHNTGRYRGIAQITLKIKDRDIISQELRQLLLDSSVAELKWSKLRTARERFAALKILNYVVTKANKNTLRVDALTWYTEDSRHKIQGRSDNRNFRRMYYFIYKNVFCKLWPKTAVWKLCPDENADARFQSMAGYLSEIFDYVTGEPIADLIIKEVEEIKSQHEPLIQVADLFAGLAVYSRSSYDLFERWLQQRDLGPDIAPTSRMNLSNSDRERCEVLARFDEHCKTGKTGVSLKRLRGLRTFNPTRPINFWWYEPQTDLDKAPIWKSYHP